PPPGVWPRIERRIGVTAATKGPHDSARWWFALAAMMAIVALLVGVTLRTPSQPAPAKEVNADTAQTVESELRLAEEHYDKAIKGLEQMAAAGQGSLDSNTAATLQKNLAVIDQAIHESRAAMRAQPATEPAEQ